MLHVITSPVLKLCKSQAEELAAGVAGVVSLLPGFFGAAAKSSVLDYVSAKCRTGVLS